MLVFETPTEPLVVPDTVPQEWSPVEFDDEVLNVLRKARNYLAKPHAWCRGRYQKNRPSSYRPGASERLDLPLSDWLLESFSFCSLGIIHHLAATPQLQNQVKRELARAMGVEVGLISTVNDRRSTMKGDVLAYFDRAIERRESFLRRAQR